VTGNRLNVAVTLVMSRIVTWQTPVVPVQPAPSQPAKVEPAEEVAVRVTGVLQLKA